MKTVKEEIANNLLFYRKRAKLTQKDLAESIGVKNNTISQWENGTNSIDVEVLFNICEVLGISVNDMYGAYAHTSELALTPEEMDLITNYRSLDQRGKNAVSYTIEKELIYISDMEQEAYLVDREAYIKNNSLPFAAAGGDSSNLDEAQELYDKSRSKHNPDGK